MSLIMRRRTAKWLIKVVGVLTLATFMFLLITAVFPKSDHNEIHQRFHKNYAKLQKSQPFASKEEHPVLNQLEAEQRRRIDSLNLYEKKDWNDYAAIASDLARTGLGEKGEAAKLSNNKKKEKLMFNQNGFNALLSDMISVNRSIPDIRFEGCKTKKYLSKLPKASVIFIFYNEHFSVLMRSVYSILNRSPPELIEEIILVDDFSDRDALKQNLDDYIAKNLPKVKVVRLRERSGLITARLAGAKVALGEVLIFLDSHIEANYNWLPPLLEPIALNPNASVCPFIDVIDHTAFTYRAQDEGARGAFDWQLWYKRLPLLPEDIIDRSKPFKSPIMAGGLFAIGAKFFWDLGGYDEGLDIWGGEQYELSFKIWMCGGELLDAPCSRIGHIYRGPRASTANPRTTDYVHKNYKRVAEVWMDEYKQYVYDHDPGIYDKIDAGDISKQKQIRETNQCKSFKWFMESVAFDLPKVYPPVEPPDYAYGTIKSLAAPNLCVDTLNSKVHSRIGLFYCAGNDLTPQRKQFWTLSYRRDLRIKASTHCMDVSSSGKNAPVNLWECHGQHGNQFWFYDAKKKLVKQGTNLDRCLEADVEERQVYVNYCDEDNLKMKWEFGFANQTALAEFNINEEEF